MHSGSSNVLSAQPIFSVATGIASIILEGRSLSDDDFIEADIESYLVKKTNTLHQDARLQKLLQIRSDGDTNYPGTSKDFIGCSIKTEKNKDLGTLQSLATTCLSTNSSPPSQSSSQLSYSSTICSYQSSKKKSTNSKIPKQGPHCEHFLKYIGVIKTEDVDENFEHFCNETNDYCVRWQNYLRQLQLILCSEPICIEVFIGPENNAILMEQWIIKIIEKTNGNGTNLPLTSLCCAIRSQLHFSQISSWTDLLKTSCDNDFFDNPRIRKTKKLGKPKLDILYRIKTFDSTTCFNEKPLVHEFPEAAITEKWSISVCLKSSPRCKSIPNFLQQVDNLEHQQNRGGCMEKGKHNCQSSSYETNERNLENKCSSSSTTHREKQLLKYKKRLLKYEKKTTTTTSCCSSDDRPKSDINFSINSIRPPLYTTNCMPFYNNSNLLDTTKSTQTANTEMITTGTQTEDEFCVCLNLNLFNENSTATMDKSDLLLQSIQRTGVVNSISCHRKLKTKLSSSDCSSNLDQVDCRLCKRQKTKHNFVQNSPNSLYSQRQWEKQTTCQCPSNLNNNNTITDLNKLKICSPINDRHFIEESQFQTPINSINQTQAWEMGNSTKFSFDRKLVGKTIPKINLTQKFNESPSISPITSPYSPTSPLTAKNLISAAILKRRSRHLSEISSERSSIGSEEHISDDEFCNFSPVFLSPNKSSRNYFAKEILPFGRRALLGSLEESLLQKCFTPKFTIYGFKVLLGASGQFCPTQLTIPVVTSLYELKSQTLTTPYMVRLSSYFFFKFEI